MEKKEFYHRIKRLILEIEFLVDEDLVYENWDEKEMIGEDIVKLNKILEQLKEIEYLN